MPKHMSRRTGKPAQAETNAEMAVRLLETAVARTDQTAAQKPGDKLKSELDELLDDIDEVLEENAADFVRQYVQKSGQ